MAYYPFLPWVHGSFANEPATAILTHLVLHFIAIVDSCAQEAAPAKLLCQWNMLSCGRPVYAQADDRGGRSGNG